MRVRGDENLLSARYELFPCQSKGTENMKRFFSLIELLVRITC